MRDGSAACCFFFIVFCLEWIKVTFVLRLMVYTNWFVKSTLLSEKRGDGCVETNKTIIRTISIPKTCDSLLDVIICQLAISFKREGVNFFSPCFMYLHMLLQKESTIDFGGSIRCVCYQQLLKADCFVSSKDYRRIEGACCFSCR